MLFENLHVALFSQKLRGAYLVGTANPNAFAQDLGSDELTKTMPKSVTFRIPNSETVKGATSVKNSATWRFSRFSETECYDGAKYNANF